MSHDRRFVTEDSARARCRPEEVMEFLLDPSTWPSWQPEIKAVEGPDRLAPGGVVRGHATMLGFDVSGHSEAMSVEAASFEEDVIVGVRMHIRYEVTPLPVGALVTQRLTANLPGGVSGWVLSLFLRRRLKSMQRRALSQLVRQSELG